MWTARLVVRDPELQYSYKEYCSSTTGPTIYILVLYAAFSHFFRNPPGIGWLGRTWPFLRGILGEAVKFGHSKQCRRMVTGSDQMLDYETENCKNK